MKSLIKDLTEPSLEMFKSKDGEDPEGILFILNDAYTPHVYQSLIELADFFSESIPEEDIMVKLKDQVRLNHPDSLLFIDEHSALVICYYPSKTTRTVGLRLTDSEQKITLH